MGVYYRSISDLPAHMREQARKQMPPARVTVKKGLKRAPKRNQLIDHVVTLLKVQQLPKYEVEYHFAKMVVPGINPKPRKYRFDFAWPERLVALEVDGMTYGRPLVCDTCGMTVRHKKLDGSRGQLVLVGGGHTQGSGYDADREKDNLAAALGWVVLRVTAPMIRQEGAWLYQLECVLASRAEL
ncbi:hypothetical protein LCGC14_1458690 [marine sediment metagenome]|uniref:DUF559 domain-containing protein n=1 Tax=marine sediment metagenome TaxID=412755 RepID=A0A0F9K1T8_9ZZZZ